MTYGRLGTGISELIPHWKAAAKSSRWPASSYRLQHVPDARGRSIDRDVGLAVAVVVARNRDIGADAPLISDRRCEIGLDRRMYQTPEAGR